MKITLAQAFDFEATYMELKDASLPVKTAFFLSKLNTQLEKDTEFYRKKLNEIVGKYAEKDEKGQYVILEDQSGIKLRPGCLEECNKEISELQDIEIEFGDSVKFKLEDFDGVKLTMGQLNSIMPFIEE